MNRCISSIILMFLVLNAVLPVYANEDTQQNFNSAQPFINSIHTVNPNLPTNVPEQKGRVGEILTRLFIKTGPDQGKIGNWFLKMLGTREDGRILRWVGDEGGKLETGSIYDNGVGISIGGPVISGTTFNVEGNSIFDGDVNVGGDISFSGTLIQNGSPISGGKFVDGTDSDDAVYTAGRVGIGTNTPSSGLELDVEGSVGANLFCDENGVNCFDPATVVISGSGSSISGSGTPNYLVKFTETGTTLADSVLYDDGTNIGIGITNPTQKFQVDGTIKGGNIIGTRLISGREDDLSDRYHVNFYRGGNSNNSVSGTSFFISSKGDGSEGIERLNIGYNNGGSDVFSLNINDNGNVGIGDVTPTAKLTVNGNIIANDPTANNHVATKSYVDSISGSGAFVESTIADDIDTNYVPRDDGTKLVTGTIYDDGTNIGIGITNPERRLHVNGEVLSVMNSINRNDDTLTRDGIRFFRSGNGTNFDGSVNSSFRIRTRGDGAGGVEDFQIAYSEPGSTNSILTINKSQNVGVGTNSPTAKLEVDGNIIANDPTLATHVATKNYVDTQLSGGNIDIDDLGDAKTDTTSIFLGDRSGTSDDGNNSNTAIGIDALNSNTSGIQNVALGRIALRDNSSGQYNSAIGHGALNSNTTGDNNVALGRSALSSNTTASNNIALGRNALAVNTTGAQNTAIGSFSLDANTTGIYNTSVGYAALGNATIGNNNTTIGRAAGGNITTGSSNIIIGSNVDAPSATASNQLNIGNTIYGNLANGNIGIGTATPESTLELVKSDNNFLTLDTEGNTASSVQGIQFKDRHNASNQGADGQITSYIQSERSGSSAYYDLTFATVNTAAGDATEKLRIRGDGNVGIGTASPSKKLDVIGVIRGGTGSATSGQTLFEGRYTAADTLNIWGSQRSTGANVFGYAIRPKDRAAGFTSAAGNAAFAKSVLVQGPDLTFSTSPAATVAVGADITPIERFRITNAGNVGIGISNPSAKLEVFDINSAEISIRTQGAGSIASPRDISLTYKGYQGRERAQIKALEKTSSTNSSDLVFSINDGSTQTNLTERMRIIANGNVGIGTTTPSSKLHVTDTSGVSASLATFTGESDSLVIRNYAAGDYEIKNTQQENGIRIADGIGGVQILYNNTERLAANNLGVDVTGRLNVTGTVSGAEPTASNHLTTKNYVDTLVTAGVSWKAPVPNGSTPTATHGACNASREGWATYNSSDNVIYLCNASAWVNIGSTAVIPNATTTSPGKIQISGDIEGTWDNIVLRNNVVESSNILNGTIVSGDLATDSIGTREIENNSIAAIDIAPDGVGSSEILNGAVRSQEIEDNTIISDDLAADSVGSSEIIDESITAADLGINSVGQSELGVNSVGNANIRDDSVRSQEIVDDTITEDDISDLFVARSASKLDPSTRNWLGDLESTPRSMHSGGFSVGFVDSTQNAPIPFGSLMNVPSLNSGQDGSAGQIIFPYAQSYTGNGNPIFRVGLFNNSSWSSWKTFLDKDWADTLYLTSSDSILGDNIVDGTIDSSEIEDNTITSDDLAIDSVGTQEIEDNTIISDDLAADSVGSSEIIDESITAADLGINSVGQSELGPNSVGNANIRDNSVRSQEIVDDTILSDDIKNATIRNEDIALNTIVANRLAPNSVGNSELIDNPLVTSLFLGNTDTSIFRDGANRLATDDSFYVRSGSDTTRLYSDDTYLGDTSGATIHVRGNNLTWDQGIIQGGGNVGIGITTPLSKLHVVGVGGSNEGFRLANAAKSVDWYLSDNTNTSDTIFDYSSVLGSQMKFKNNGNISILTASGSQGVVIGGDTLTAGVKLDVKGDIQAVAYLNSSDRNLKQHIKTLSGLDIITKLRGVRFDWKKDTTTSIGLIAQEVEEVIPEIVHTDSISGYKSVQYGSLVAPLIQAVKEQQEQIEASNKEIEFLKNEIQSLRSLIHQ